MKVLQTDMGEHVRWGANCTCNAIVEGSIPSLSTKICCPDDLVLCIYNATVSMHVNQAVVFELCVRCKVA